MKEKCSNCNHFFGEKCKRCGREFGCGICSINCGHENCKDTCIPFTDGEQQFLEKYNKEKYDVSKSDPIYGPNGLVYE